MRGGDLPPTCETVDAELYAILQVLRETALEEDAADRRVVILSDCENALEMIEKRWRRGERGNDVRAARAGILEAINTYRGRLGLVVMVYTKSHVGGSANAMADACAKAALHLEQRYDVYNAHMMDGLKEGRWMRTTSVDTEEGSRQEVVWDVDAFSATREAAGVWIRAQEAERLSEDRRTGRAILVDAGRLWGDGGMKGRSPGRYGTRCGRGREREYRG